jgi:hypothetical protein
MWRSSGEMLTRTMFNVMVSIATELKVKRLGAAPVLWMGYSRGSLAVNIYGWTPIWTYRCYVPPRCAGSGWLPQWVIGQSIPHIACSARIGSKASSITTGVCLIPVQVVADICQPTLRSKRDCKPLGSWIPLTPSHLP